MTLALPGYSGPAHHLGRTIELIEVARAGWANPGGTSEGDLAPGLVCHLVVWARKKSPSPTLLFATYCMQESEPCGQESRPDPLLAAALGELALAGTATM